MTPVTTQADDEVVDRCRFHVARSGRQRRLRAGAPPTPPAPLAPRVPRLTRLLALAHHYQALLDRGVVRDQAELARLAGVTRPRVTQVMNLLALAPEIQEEILGLPRTERGRDAVTERQVRAIAGVVEWGRQRETWRALKSSLTAA